ncbi:hypothetical protein PHISP_00789 [Aspergillus sp. HF37]|nr:hypothetical protein PHISP_00789 [Aspergillus sp. HF37]
MGLDPSVYGGGGSSSGDFPDDSPFWSRERDALVSLTIGDEGRSCEGSSTGGGGPSAGREVDSGSVTLERSGAGSEAKERDEKGGGLEKDELDEASEGECGGSAASSSTRESAS